LHCDCLGLAAIKWFLTAFETLNLLTYLLTNMLYGRCSWNQLYHLLSMLRVLHAFFTHLVLVVETFKRNVFKGCTAHL